MSRKRLKLLWVIISLLMLCTACGKNDDTNAKASDTFEETFEASNDDADVTFETTEDDIDATSETSIDNNDDGEDKYVGMREITTAELVCEMGLGINLGNTFESCGDWIAQYGDGSVESYETAWGSPVITQEMIQGYADAGYGVLRIPVAWSNLADENYNLSPAYLKAVQEVVDWALESGMYVIINIHHDNFWMADFPNNPEGCMARYEKIWQQVADYFKDYNDYLMFESLNEEACWDDVWNEWNGTEENKKIVFDLCNSINQKFVDVVRNSGGNNPKRHLLIAGYATSIDLSCDELYRMPDDPENRLALSIHYYTPAAFAILTEDADWGKCQYSWGTESEIAFAQQEIAKLDKFINNGIPVIMGEYGCPLVNKDMDSVYKYLTIIPKIAYDHQICPILWDTTGNVYNRETCEVNYPALLDAYKAILNGEDIPEGSMRR